MDINCESFDIFLIVKQTKGGIAFHFIITPFSKQNISIISHRGASNTSKQIRLKIRSSESQFNGLLTIFFACF